MGSPHAARQVIDKPTSSLGAGSLNVEDATEQLWAQFQESTVPTLKDIESQITGRQTAFVDEATESVNKTSNMLQQQAAANRESLGISLNSREQESSDRLGVLGRASSMVSAKNDAVDVADGINKGQAAALTSVQTGLTQDALSNLQGSANLADAREGADAANQTAANGQNLQTMGTVATMAMMFM